MTMSTKCFSPKSGFKLFQQAVGTEFYTRKITNI